LIWLASSFFSRGLFSIDASSAFLPGCDEGGDIFGPFAGGGGGPGGGGAPGGGGGGGGGITAADTVYRRHRRVERMAYLRTSAVQTTAKCHRSNATCHQNTQDFFYFAPHKRAIIIDNLVPVA